MKFELSDKLLGMELIKPRPTTLQAELWLKNKLVWKNVDAIIVAHCYDVALLHNHVLVPTKDLLLALHTNTVFNLQDKEHQQLLEQLLINHISLFAKEQQLKIGLVDDGSKVAFIW